MPDDLSNNDMIDAEDQYTEADPPSTAPGFETQPPIPVVNAEAAPEPDNDSMIAEPDEPKPQEPPAEGDTEEAPPANPYDDAFKSRGLDGQYKDVNDMILRVPALNKFVTTTAQRNAELERRISDMEQQRAQQQANANAGEYDPDDFVQNPYPELDKRYVTQNVVADLQGQLQQMRTLATEQRINSFAQEHPDFNDMQPQIYELLQREPALANLKDPLPILYNTIKAQQAPIQAQNQQIAQETVSANRTIEKKRATTAGSGAKPVSRSKPTPDDLYNMSEDELTKYIGYAPEQ